VWFKTGTAGGRLLGFGNAPYGASTSLDRNLYLTNAGTLVFGVNPGPMKSIASAASYNDNRWHLATATMSTTAGMVLYVDGAQVATDPTVLLSGSMAGYWRVDYDSLTGWPSAPTNSYFTGQLDEASFYKTTLSPAQVLAHFQANQP
jgi:hypothetical protein